MRDSIWHGNDWRNWESTQPEIFMWRTTKLRRKNLGFEERYQFADTNQSNTPAGWTAKALLAPD
ncbi:MAG: hypothetical protein ACK5Y6_07205 [Pseudomonadota bacterium]